MPILTRLVAATALTLSLVLPATSPAQATAPLQIPPPTGELPVAVRSAFLPDPARPEPATGGRRTLPLQIWYPTMKSPTLHDRAPYLSAVVRPAVESLLGVPAGTLTLDTHAVANAPARRDVRGVILFSAGLGLPAAFETGQVIDLVSRGWVVVSIDHPHDTIWVEQPGGVLIKRDLPDTAEGGEIAFEQRVLDTSLVLRHLTRLVPGWRPTTPTGMFGHSIGGATAAESIRLHPVLRAGVNLDGTPRGDVVETGLDRPFGTMLSNVRLGLPVEDTNLTTFLANLRGPHPLEELHQMGHDGFTDFVFLTPQAASADPALGAHLNTVFDTQSTSVAQGSALLAQQRRFLTRFMARHLTR